MDRAIIGRGGGLAVWLASLFRFRTVAVGKNSSLAPVRPFRPHIRQVEGLGFELDGHRRIKEEASAHKRTLVLPLVVVHFDPR